MEDKKIVFVNGLISKDVADTTPEWILGKMDIDVENLIIWLSTTGRQVATNGWINAQVKRSKKTGKRYIEVEDDSWKTKGKVEIKKESPDIVVPKMDTGEINPNDIPF
jgi:hypothetical protein